MKKAQILSAIALAFALGVVAPVAGVNALVIEDTTVTPNVQGTATRTDLDNAVDAVEANAIYKAMVAVSEAKAKVTAGDYADVTTQVTAVLTAVDNSTPAGVTAGKSELANPSDQQIIDAAKTTTNYDIYADIKTAVDDDNLAGLKSLILNKYNKIDGVTAIDASTITDASAFDLTTLDNWSYYNGIMTAVETAQKAVNAETEGLTTLKAVLSKTLNEAGQTALKALEDADNVTVASLANLIDDTNIDNYTKWVAVETAVKGAEPNDSGETNGNYTKLMAIARAYKAATNNLSETAEEIAATLAAYVAPETPTTPGEDGDTDTDKDPSAPGTGVLSSADGNAATTVSIVAGLATALTALGAGVVAYRSARRSSEK